MLEGFQLDPYTVLGLSRDATSQEIRDAFRLKSKKHHPDLGGDDWAFRIVMRAYELLGEGRGESGHGPTVATPTYTASPIHPAPAADTGTIRPGVFDRGMAPSRIVAVEIIWMRYEVEDVMELLSLAKEKRNLSGSVHMTWPDREQPGMPATIPGSGAIIRDLVAAFENLKVKTKASDSQLTTADDKFDAWVSYPSGSLAWDAFKTLHMTLKIRNFGVRQWTRDLSVPR